MTPCPSVSSFTLSTSWERWFPGNQSRVAPLLDATTHFSGHRRSMMLHQSVCGVDIKFQALKTGTRVLLSWLKAPLTWFRHKVRTHPFPSNCRPECCRQATGSGKRRDRKTKAAQSSGPGQRKGSKRIGNMSCVNASDPVLAQKVIQYAHINRKAVHADVSPRFGIRNTTIPVSPTPSRLHQPSYQRQS